MFKFTQPEESVAAVAAWLQVATSPRPPACLVIMRLVTLCAGARHVAAVVREVQAVQGWWWLMFMLRVLASAV